MLAQHVLDRRNWRTPEYFAALVIFDGLARELGTTSAEASQRIATDRVADALGVFLSMDRAELGRGAQRLWESLLGQRLPPLRALN